MLDFMTKRFEEIYVVHRLDKETSGVMLFAKNEKAHKHACHLFENRGVTKEYLAILEGTISKPEGTIDQPIMALSGGKGKQQIHPDGKNSVSEYKLINNYRGYSLVSFYPKTGRTHQIRVHAAYLGAPILADKLYGYSKEFMVSTIKKRKYKSKKFEEERPLLSRHALHAKSIKFEGLDQTPIEISAELPKDMKATIHQMNKLISD